MRAKIFSLIFPFCAAILSGMLLVLAFPDHNISWLVWVGLVPLLIAIGGKNLKSAFFSSFVCGIVYFACNFDWMFNVRGYKLYHQAILITFMSLYFAFFGLAFNFIAKRLGPVCAHFSAPFIWVSLEYVRSHFFFLALPEIQQDLCGNGYV